MISRLIRLSFGSTGVEKRPEATSSKVEWHVAAKRSKVRAMPEGLLKTLTQELEKLKAQIRAKVEHPFHVVKNLFGFRKVRYRGLKKNTAQLQTLFALANLVITKGRLLAATRA
jgi:IS5 family transposase